jgi:hypothetical protein
VPKHSCIVATVVLSMAVVSPSSAQEIEPPVLQAGTLPDSLNVDGVLDEPAWMSAPIADAFTQNTRLRWTFRPVADLFIVYNHNVRSILDRWQLDSNQLLVKVQYALRY